MVECQYGATRLGNRMFTYALARIIAEELGFMLKAEPASPRIATSPLPLSCTGIYDTPVEDWTEEAGRALFDLNATLACHLPRKIHVQGCFQNYYPLFHKYADRVCQYFILPDLERLAATYCINASDVLIHLRKEDITGWSHDLPDSWYLGAVERLKGRRLFMITPDPRCPIAIKLQTEYGVQHVHEGVEGDIAFASLFNCLVLSQGTYSWWCAFLSKATEVYQADPLDGWNSNAFRQATNYQIDLRLPGNRWIYTKTDWTHAKVISQAELDTEYTRVAVQQRLSTFCPHGCQCQTFA